ncbi:hypothetical protein [Streptomyces sp. NPDC090994]|uniref:hypothetical protein n=1 Tax=Streptomyces sp. NPDC090994 TaxID=3365969 RepID=UPI00381E7A4C
MTSGDPREWWGDYENQGAAPPPAPADGASPPAPHPQAYGAPPPPSATCPACHHTYRHQPGCPLTPLPVEDAAALGHDAAVARVREQGDGRHLPAPGAPAAAAPACPACHHTIRHRRGCALEPLPVDDAALLGYDAALDRVHALLAAVPSRGGPPPADACPGCHHTRRHGPGCELAALTVAEASALGHRAALDHLRARTAADGGGPQPRPGGLRGWLRRLTRRS